MYKIKEEKLTSSKVQLSCENIKKELVDSIDYENKRINVDNAKKRAVAQGMNYDGFRQMVLGANIKAIKTKEFSELGNLYNAKCTLNSQAIKHATSSTNGDDDAILQGKIPKIGEEELVSPENFREFRKNFEKIIDDSSLDEKERILKGIYYMTCIPNDKYNKVFILEFSAEYLLKILKLWHQYLTLTLNEEEDTTWISMLRILENFAKVTGFAFNILGFLSKKEKAEIKQFFELLSSKVPLKAKAKATVTTTITTEPISTLEKEQEQEKEKEAKGQAEIEKEEEEERANLLERMNAIKKIYLN